MAENTLEIIYIPYGLDEISQLDLMTNLANGVEGYLGDKRWARKEKYRNAWLKAYLEIMNRGLIGASNEGGIWKIKHKGENFNLDAMSNLEREMYQDAAYYIRNLMALLPTRKKLEEQNKENDKKKETKKTSYDNKLFQGGLTSFVSNLDYGGKESKEWANDWRKLDLETNGIYSREKRQAKLAEYLKGYRDKLELEQDKWDFSKGPYGSYEEFSNRINNAIRALNNSEWNLDDINALNRLGLDREAWLSNGENDVIPLTDLNGNIIKNVSRAEYNTLLEEQNKKIEEAKAKEEAEKKKKELEAVRSNISKYRGIFTYVPNSNTFGIFNFKNANSAEDIVAHVRNNFANINSNDEFRKKSNEILGAYKILGENKKLKPISNETWNTLNMSKKFSEDKGRGLDKSKFMQLEGIDNIIFDSESRKVYYLDKEVPTKKMMDTVLKYRQKVQKALLEYTKNRFSGPTLVTHKYGGQINPSLDTIIEDFIKNNNI